MQAVMAMLPISKNYALRKSVELSLLLTICKKEIGTI